ncbi:hypothetical protein FQA47_013155 [Oryzias melastigma]|uniref:Uncharacterized protein n=1 Tax=Oryzias melastigma TaxID=30732 RepID=A0A834BLT5_ORYME|nr:hypothetical protein FQA47_013155 [Oryzias melastigma]
MKAAVAWQPFINSKTVGNRIICRTSVIIQEKAEHERRRSIRKEQVDHERRRSIQKEKVEHERRRSIRKEKVEHERRRIIRKEKVEHERRRSIRKEKVEHQRRWSMSGGGAYKQAEYKRRILILLANHTLTVTTWTDGGEPNHGGGRTRGVIILLSLIPQTFPPELLPLICCFTASVLSTPQLLCSPPTPAVFCATPRGGCERVQTPPITHAFMTFQSQLDSGLQPQTLSEPPHVGGLEPQTLRRQTVMRD